MAMGYSGAMRQVPVLPVLSCLCAMQLTHKHEGVGDLYFPGIAADQIIASYEAICSAQ